MPILMLTGLDDVVSVQIAFESGATDFITKPINWALLAERLIGESDTIRHLADLDIPAFPGGTLFRNPLKTMALTWYALLDRI